MTGMSVWQEKTVLKVSVIAGLTRNLVNAANNLGDCGSEAAMTGMSVQQEKNGKEFIGL